GTRRPRRRSAAQGAGCITRELRNVKLDLLDAEKALESTQADLDEALSNLAEREFEFKNTMTALANSEQARLETRTELDKELSNHTRTKLELQNMKEALANSERARQEANANRVLPRPPREQEVFV
ncbi:hypothetical protein BGZ46_005460, partial [Entomortierella lignicola]